MEGNVRVGGEGDDKLEGDDGEERWQCRADERDECIKRGAWEEIKLCVKKKKSGKIYATGWERIHISDLSLETSEVMLMWEGRGSVFPNHTWLPTQRTWSPACQKPTIVGGVDAFEQATLGLEAADAVPLAVKHLQPGEDGGIQVRQPIIPHVQLGHVPQQVRLIWDHAGDLIQPDRGGREEAKVQLRLDQVELRRLWPFL